MIRLVDYDDTDEESADDPQYISSKALPSETQETFNGCDPVGNDGASLEVSQLLACLPSSKNSKNIPVQQELELEDLVKRKDWELKLAEKVERKRRNPHRHHKEKTSETVGSSDKSLPAKKNPKKMVVIQAFGELKNLVDDIGEESHNKSDKPPNSVVPSSSSLLSALPEPKVFLKPRKDRDIVFESSICSGSNGKRSEVVRSKQISKDNTCEQNEGCEVSDDECDVTDFFGIKTSDDPSSLCSTYSSQSSVDQNQIRLVLDEETEEDSTNSFLLDETGSECHSESISSSSGEIDNDQALYMIYSRDVEHMGGTISNAAKAVEDMVDVSVDQVLGSNVRATLLKNLHNKSLAEATLSHLTRIPKNKNINAVARRKHQITYLASVAVAREEQLAEQWSQNRHNKRTSARKYGF